MLYFQSISTSLGPVHAHPLPPTPRFPLALEPPLWVVVSLLFRSAERWGRHGRV